MKGGVIGVIRAVILLILPTRAARLLLGSYGREIDKTARIGLAWVVADQLAMHAGSRIRNGNYIRVANLRLGRGAYVGAFNVIRGRISLEMEESSGLGNRNTVTRHESFRSIRCLKMGTLTKITAGHHVDITCDVILGNYTTIAGKGSQIWTHGYVHDRSGPGRYRIDGAITIGDNVYVGSMCMISMGVTIGDGAIVGGGTSVASSLSESGLYVSSPMRKLSRPPDPASRADLKLDPEFGTETVYRKV